MTQSIAPLLLPEDAGPAPPPLTHTATASEVPRVSRARKVFQSPGAMLAASVVVFVVTCGLMSVVSLRAPVLPGVFGFSVSALLALAGVTSGITRVYRRSPNAGALATTLTMAATIVNLAWVCIGALAALASTIGFARGRQLRRWGRIQLPKIVSGSSWAHTKVTVVANEPIPLGLAHQWRENGRTEHASVAAFARLTLDLMALGAPPRLIASSNADALDEIRHTELCFSLARSLDGVTLDPGPFPAAAPGPKLFSSRDFSLAMLAVDSLVDGALHEGVSARVIAKLAKRCEVPAIRGVLKEIAADEGRHAAHGWDVVEWCLEQGGAPVAEALRGAIGAIPMRARSSLPRAALEGTWERWGIHGEALEREEYSATRSYVIERVAKMLAKGVASEPLSVRRCA
jgi:hypothetical protein